VAKGKDDIRAYRCQTEETESVTVATGKGIFLVGSGFFSHYLKP